MLFCRYTLVIVPLAFLVAGCSSDSDNPLSRAEGFQYQVTITNLTPGQPLSPAAVVIHGPDWQGFALGEPASLGLEMLAEGGDNTQFLAAAEADNAVFGTVSGQGVIVPGATDGLTANLSADPESEFFLTWASMPVNTNDGLAALSSIDLRGLSVGDSETYFAISFDAGTEANTETADTVPGPAASGLAEGFNAARDDVRNAVYIHPGVVTQDDGLSGSTLSGSQRWDNPIARVRIERLQ